MFIAAQECQPEIFHVSPRKERYLEMSAVYEIPPMLYVLSALNRIKNRLSEESQLKSQFNYDLSCRCQWGCGRGAIICSSAEHSVEQADKSPALSSTARQIQGAPSIWANVRSAVVWPPGGLWKWEKSRTFHTQHRTRLFLFLQVGILYFTGSSGMSSKAISCSNRIKKSRIEQLALAYIE